MGLPGEVSRQVLQAQDDDRAWSSDGSQQGGGTIEALLITPGWDGFRRGKQSVSDLLASKKGNVRLGPLRKVWFEGA